MLSTGRLLSSLTRSTMRMLGCRSAVRFAGNGSNAGNVEEEDLNLDQILRVQLVPNGKTRENAYILFNSETCDGALIDPGYDGYKLLCAIEKCQTNISKILLTHGHANHVACIMEVMRNFGSLPIYLVESEKPNLEKVLTSGSVMGDEIELNFIKDQDKIEVAGHEGTVITTPGHTAGSVCYHFGNFLFTGDTIMCNKVGELSYPDSDGEMLKKSIREKLFILPRQTMILPGHGEFSCIATEKLFNPFVGKNAP